MSSNKSRPTQDRVALMPQRSHGKQRVAALLEAGATVIAEKGFPAATMAEIALRAGAPIGSLYRFFPNKEILADALLQRFAGLMVESFDRVDRQVKTLSLAELTRTLLSLLADLRGERPTVRALLEAHSNWSIKRIEFRKAVIRRIAQTLRLRAPHLSPKTAGNVAVIILQNMKMVNTLNEQFKGEARTGAMAELHEMTQLYLADKLKER